MTWRRWYDGTITAVHALGPTATVVLGQILQQQPLGPAKIAFAWRMAAGATLAAATTIRWSDGRLVVRPRTDEWRREVIRARPIVLVRLRAMVGDEAIRAMEIEKAD